MTKAKTLAEKFFGKIADDPMGGPCVVWTGSRNNSGYGRMTHYDKSLMATHVSWFLKYGVWPTKLVLHTCDNPSCVRIAHLWEGTHQDNMDDKVRKNRQGKGSQIGSAKLIEPNIAEIKLLTEARWTAKDIATKLGVDRSTIGAVRQARGWRHVNQQKMVKPKQTYKEPHDMTYDVGDGRRLRVREIAVLAGRTEATIYYRINHGITGVELLAGRKR